MFIKTKSYFHSKQYTKSEKLINMMRKHYCRLQPIHLAMFSLQVNDFHKGFLASFGDNVTSDEKQRSGSSSEVFKRPPK